MHNAIYKSAFLCLYGHCTEELFLPHLNRIVCFRRKKNIYVFFDDEFQVKLHVL